MAAGLPVVELYMENNLYDMPQEAVLLAHYTPESIAEAIIRILDDPNLQRKMSAAGMEYMRDKDLDKGFEQFLDGVNKVLENMVSPMHFFEKMYTKSPVIADVIVQKIAKTEDMMTATESRRHRIIRKLKKIKLKLGL